MDFFNCYTSNTYAGSGNQTYFNIKDGEVQRGRAFYKISTGGRYNYSVLFSNIIDSTYSDGSISHKNLICNSWTIVEAKIGKCHEINMDKKISEMTVADEGSTNRADIVVCDLKPITFNTEISKEVMPGEFFSSDPICLEFQKDEYLCLEIAFKGTMIPNHEQSLLPTFLKTDEGWEYSKNMPFAGMIGCDRKVKAKVAYLGDSITQGIGTEVNSYKHWNAVLSQKLGEEYAFWNLGLGFGRASDAASDGAWLYKAKQNDVVVICYGVNDILNGRDEAQIKEDLNCIVNQLNKAGVKVIMQTVPPFDYSEDKIIIWNSINEYIKTTLSKKVAMVFDAASYLAESKENPQKAKFGGHPDAVGCKIWAEAFYEKLICTDVLDEI